MTMLLVAAGKSIVAGGAKFLAQAAVAAAVTVAQRALMPDQTTRRQGTRLDNSQIVTSNEGTPISNIIGRNRVAGQVIWQTTFREEVVTNTEESGGKGAPSSNVETTTYNYHASFAIGLCQADGSAKYGQVWADGKPLKPSDHTIRFYNGAPDQLPDPKIEAVEGAGEVSAYRGLCYIVFDEMLLEKFGNRLPQITVEIINIPEKYQSNEALEKSLRSINIIPSTGEFVYGTDISISKERRGPGASKSISLNDNAFEDGADIQVSLDQLQASAVNLSSASLVVAWFGTSMNAAACEVKPKLDLINANITPNEWQVTDRVKTNAEEVILEYGGTPSDISVRQAIQDIKSRGLRAMFYPFILMDVDGYPWRGRIIGDATIFAGTVGTSDFTVWDGTQIPYSGANEWSHKRMIYHYAWLMKDVFTAGDVFLIGSEMVGLSADVNWGIELTAILAGVRSILPVGVKVSYAADWSEYKETSLTPVWSSADFVGIDNYMPLTDWRDGEEDYSLTAFMAGIEGDELWDYYYLSPADRDAKIQTPITGAQFRQKDIRFWRDANHTGKEIYFTEFGCPSVDKGANQPNVFYDPKSDESSFPYFSDGSRNDYNQRLYLEAMLKYWDDNGLVDPDNMFAWVWDARPYPAFPSNSKKWSDGGNWEKGHWLNGRLDALSLEKVILSLSESAGLDVSEIDVTALAKVFTLVRGLMWSDITPAANVIQNLLTSFHIDVFETDGRLTFVPKAESKEVVIDPDDFLIDDPIDASFSKSKIEPSALPQRTIVEFVDEYRDYQIAAVSGSRSGAQTSNIDRFASLSIVLSDYAQSLADSLTQEKWVGRDTISFSLPLIYKDIICGDWFLYERKYKIIKVTYGDQLDIEAVGFNKGVYKTVQHAGSIPKVTSPVSVGQSSMLAAEIPLLNDTLGNLWSPRLIGDQDPWPGSINVYVDDGSGGYVINTSLSAPTFIGEIVADLPKGALYIWDEANEVKVNFHDPSKTLSSASDTSVRAGANTIAVLTPSGEWEIIQFANAQLNGDGTYTLTKLLRGQLGTEAFMGEPTLSGTTMFVVDYQRMTYIKGGASRFNIETSLRHGAIGYNVSDNRYSDLVVTPRGVAYRPYAPGHLHQTVDGGTDDIVLTWVRRTRFDGDSWDAVEVPLNEEFEKYEVDIYNGGSIVRTIEVDSVTSAVYSQVDQITDFGSTQTAIIWKVYQLSAIYGRGTSGEE